MNKNGEKTKLLAVIAVFAMVACALPVADAASDDVKSETVANVDGFNKALADSTIDKIVLSDDLSFTAPASGDAIVTIDRNVTIDLGGNTVTLAKGTDASSAKFGFLVSDGASVVIENGGITNTAADAFSNTGAPSVIKVIKSVLTLNNVDVTGVGDSTYAISIDGDATAEETAATLNVNGGSIIAKGFASAVSTNGTNGNEVISINGSALASDKGVAVYSPSDAVWTITETDITGVTGIDMRSGDITVTGGSITFNTAANDKTANNLNQGPLGLGVAVSVLDAGYNADDIAISINDVDMNNKSYDKAINYDVIVSAFEYSDFNGTDNFVEKIFQSSNTQATTAPISVSYDGVEIAYADGASATASGVQVGTNGTAVTSGAASSTAVDPNTSVKFTSVGTGATIALGTGAKADFAAEPSGVTIVAASGASVTVNGQASTVKPVDNVTVSTSEDLAKNVALGIAKISTDGAITLTETVTLGANQTLTLGGDLTISEGVTLTNNGTLVTSSCSVVLDGGVFVNNGATTGVVKIIDSESQNGAVLENVLGTFTAENGSIVLDGDFTSDSEDADAIAKIYIRAGVLRVSGSINGNVEIAGYTESGGTFSTYDYVVIDDLSVNGKLTLDVDKVYFEDVSVNNGGTLVLNKVEDANDTFIVGKAPETVGEVEAKFLLYGTLVPSSIPGQYGTTLYDDVTLTVNEEGEFHAYSGSILNNHITVTGEGNINLDQAQYTTVVDEDIGADRTFGQQENATIVSTLNIKAGVMVYVLGGFTVNDGVVLTIEAGATLVINSAVASMIVDGTIVVEEGATLYVNEANDVAVSGAIDSYGTLNIQSTVTVSGAIDANEDSEIVANDKLTIEVGGALNVYGVMTITDITNKGTVTLNGAILKDASTIALSSDSAVVSIVSVTGDAALTGNVTLKVTDAGLQFPDKDKTTVTDQFYGTIYSTSGVRWVRPDSIDTYILSPCFSIKPDCYECLFNREFTDCVA